MHGWEQPRETGPVSELGPQDLAAPPGAWVAEACAHYGERTVALWCAALLAGEVEPDDDTAPSLTWLGGNVARVWLAREDAAERGLDYWPFVWGARGLLYAWTDDAAPAVLVGLGNPHWRVREMCAKVARLREVGEAASVLADLVDDETPRVRAAAAAALGVVGEGEDAAALHRAERDDEPSVSHAAVRALAELSRRVDREV